MTNYPTPTPEDIRNYSFDSSTSPYFKAPHTFLKVGQKVRARFRIWDTPDPKHLWGNNWGPIRAEAGEVGEVIETCRGHWPTVQFKNGITDVTDFEVEAID